MPPKPAKEVSAVRMLRTLRGQFSLADLLLALTVAAAWTAFAVNYSRVEQLKRQVNSLLTMAGELSITDPKQFHAIAQQVVRYPNEAWQVHLPEGHAYQIKLLTRGVQTTGFPDTRSTATVASGRHRIELHQEQDEERNFRIQVMVDQRAVLMVSELPDWNTIGSTSSTGVGKSQTVTSTSQPLVLKRMRVNKQLPGGSTTSAPDNEPVNGLLLWIEVSGENPAKNP